MLCKIFRINLSRKSQLRHPIRGPLLLEHKPYSKLAIFPKFLVGRVRPSCETLYSGTMRLHGRAIFPFEFLSDCTRAFQKKVQRDTIYKDS